MAPGASVWIFAGFVVTVTLMSLVTFTAELPLAVLLAWLVAVTVTDAGLGRSAGAVYSPPDVIVPTVVFPPATPFTLHVTLVFDDPLTVALNC
ncbi:MAG: hypothetical protein KGL59_13175 [Acidobacteriota bacterium]|nr:hypothetical protein [Acidobacteriota bacterium]